MSFLNSLQEKAPKALDGFGLLLLRIWVGQEFMLAGYTKLSVGLHAPAWFAGLDFPFPLSLLPPDINWLAAGLGELTLSLALLLGLQARLASLGLLFITYVAIYTVHFDLGWGGWNQIETDAGLGYKLPLMLAIMLVAVFAQGAGRYSFDAAFHRTRNRQEATAAA